MSSESPRVGVSPVGWKPVAIAVVVAVSTIGFFSGTAHDEYQQRPIARHGPAPAAGDIPLARTYAELRQTPRGASTWADVLAALREGVPGRTDAVASDPDRAAALAARSARRAYDGAPPVIPHPVRPGQDAAPECLACHDEGIRFGALRAPAHPHAAYTSCTQCHPMAEPDLPFVSATPDPRAVANRFVGLESPGSGPRWTDASPPTIPHRLQMRERCDSCHGVNGRDAIRSTHPWRQSCEQCHAPSQSAVPAWQP